MVFGADQGEDLLQSWHECCVIIFEGVHFSDVGDGFKDVFYQNEVDLGDAVFENSSDLLHNSGKVFLHDSDFSVIHQALLKVLQALDSFKLDFKGRVLKASNDELKHHVTIVLLELGCELFGHVAQGHENIVHDSRVVSLHEGQNKLNYVLQTALK